MATLLLHIPHASTTIPSKEGYLVSDAVLNDEILKLTDWFTDDLFSNDLDEAIIAPFSRIFCDVERFSDDSQEIMAKFGMGFLYEKTDTGENLRTVSTELRKKMLEGYYWKHHDRLSQAVNKQLDQFGKSLIIDCHSFPNIPRNRSLDISFPRPDFNIGTDAFHTPKKLIAASKVFFEEKGYSLGIDKPYSGTMVPMEHYHKNQNVSSIMLEVNRKLYLNEPGNLKSEGYPLAKNIVQEYLETMRSVF